MIKNMRRARARCGAVLALALALMMFSIVPAASADQDADFSAFAGSWLGHGRRLRVDLDGLVRVDYRTYRLCGQDSAPCDTVTDDGIVDGGHITLQLTDVSDTVASGAVLDSSDPTYDVGAPAVLRLNTDATVLIVHLGSEEFATFCGDEVAAGTCGA